MMPIIPTIPTIPITSTLTVPNLVATNKPLTNKAIVLDLDSTCVNSFNDPEELFALGFNHDPRVYSLRQRLYLFDMIDVTEGKGRGQYESMWGIARPHLSEFLDFCFKYFTAVCVWSAGQPAYVKSIVDSIFPRPSLSTPSLQLVRLS